MLANVRCEQPAVSVMATDESRQPDSASAITSKRRRSQPTHLSRATEYVFDGIYRTVSKKEI
jgi:hypothetical protein